MRGRRRWLVGAALVAAYGLLWVHLGPAVEGRGLAQPVAEPLSGQRTLGQAFVGSYRYLYRIEVQMARGEGARNVPEVIFHLRAGQPAEEDLFVAAVRGADIVRQGFQGFEFPPVADARGRPFSFYLEAPGGAARDGLTVFRDPTAADRRGAMYADSQRQPGSLSFRAYYQPRLYERIDVYAERLAVDKPGLFGRKEFYWGLLILYLSTFVGLLYGAAHLRLGEEG